MININLLKKGDEVLSINDKFLAVKRKNGTVDIFNIYFTKENELCVDPVIAAEIGFGEGTVTKKMEDGATTIFTF